MTLYENEKQSPTGKAAVHEAYARDVLADTTPPSLRIEGVHGEQGLTVYTTMSTFCAVCMMSIPDMRVLRNAFDDDELTLVGIPVASVDTDKKLRDYVKKMEPAYEVQIGLSQEVTQHVRDLVAQSLHADGESTPASFITDSTGRILAVQWGIPTLSELKQLQANSVARLGQ